MPDPTFKIDSTTVLSKSGTTVSVDSGVKFPAGMVVNTVYASMGAQLSFDTNTWTEVPNLSASITPKSTSNKVLVTASLNVAGQTDNYLVAIRLYRDSTAIALGDTTGSRPTCWMSVGAQPWSNYHRQQAANTFLDSPSTTSEITYKLFVWDTRDSDNVYINRSYYDHDSGASPVSLSTIMLQEIAG